MSKPSQLEAPLTITDVAELLGWSYEQARRIVHRLHAEDGRVLRRERGMGAGVRYTTTRAALRRVRPEWFETTQTVAEELLELLREMKLLRKQQEMSATAIGGLTRRIVRLERRLE